MAMLEPTIILIVLVSAGIVATFVLTVHKFLKNAK